MGEEGYRGWIKLEVPCSGQERQMGSIIRCHTSKLEPALNNLGMRIQTRGQVQVAEEQDCEPFYEANYEVVSYRFSHDLINAIQNYLKDLMTDHLMPFQRRNLVLHSSDFWSSELMCHIPEIPLAAIFFGNIQGGTFINHWEVSFWENTNRRHRDRIRNATPHVADKIGLNQIKVEFEFEFDKVDFMTIHFKHKEQDFEVTDKDQKRSRHENLLRALQTDLTNDMVRISNRQPQDPNVFIRSFATTTNAIAVVNTITAFRNLGFETVNPQNVEQELNFIKQATAIAVMDVIKDKNIAAEELRDALQGQYLTDEIFQDVFNVKVIFHSKLIVLCSESNCISTVYRGGQVAFSKDGYSIISPIGKKLSVFDLRNNTSKTLDIDCKFNIENLSVSASGFYLLDTDERGDIHFVQLISEVKTFTFRSNDTIGSVKWAPDAVRIAVCRETDLQIHDAGIWYRNKSYNPFSLTRTYKLSSDQLKSVDWSDDSELIVAGGDNKIVRVVGSKDFKNIFIHPLASHKGNIVTCQFMKDSYGMISVCKRGLANVWTCNLRPGELEEGVWQKDDEDTTDVEMDDTQKIEKIFFKKSEKYWLTESSGAGKSVDVAASQYHKETKILATTFNNGVTVLHEIPTFALIHNLKVMDSRIQTVEWNRSCDWLAIGCGKGSTSQLVVWEWQSESYVMKQQGHSLRITSAEYSPDGAMIATGAEDGKVKIWDSRSSICTVTFDEHASGVTAVKWTQSGKAILSSSLDGTIRARDRKRYRNFRTFVCLEPTQLATLAVDKSGDLVVAGAKEVFNIYIWSFEYGHLLDILSGHESAVSSIDIHGNFIVSGSWDRTIKVWTIADSKAETVEVSHEALDVKFSPAGDVIAVLTSDGVITFFESKEMINLGTIDTLLDTDPARGATDTIKRQTSAKTKTFTRIRFSPDGNLLLAGGESNTFCMYSVPERLVLKRWRIIQNRSLDGVVLDLNRRNFTEFGNMNLIDTSDEEDDEPDNKMAIKLPGTKNFDLGERRSRPEVNIYEVTYCPTGRRFAVCSTEGVAVYTLDNISIFDQFQLDGQTNVHVIRGALSNKDFTTALMATLRLNITECISQCLKAISVKQIPLVIKKENKMKDAEKDEMKDEESKGSETNGKLNDENKNPNGMNSISIPNEMWQTADKEILDGDFDDDMLQFLGSFEEVLPEGLNPTEQQPKKEKQEKKKPKKTEEPPSEDIEERRLAKKQRRREQMAANRKLKKERLARRKQREAQKTEEETVEQVSTKKEKAKKRRGEKTEISTKSKKSKKKVGISAWKQFYFLPNEILQAIEQMGFTQPTEIQSAVLPIAVRNRQDVLGAAETGSGKTLAFGIPLVARLLEEPIEEKATGPRALIIAPTRELVIQIMRHINDLIATTSLKATSIVGRLAQVKQERVITQQRPDIVVATPGRLWAMMKESEEGDYLAEWKQLKCLVVDETDRMVEEGYFAELTEILNKIHEESDKEKLQTLVFSATLTFTKAQDVAEEEKKKAKELSSRQKIQRLIKLTGLRKNKHKVIDLTQMGTAGCLVEARINCANLFEKDTALVYLLTRYPGRTIVFVNSVDAARRLHCILKSIGIDPMILHAKMVQKQRLRNLEHFSESKNAVLIATNVASRGLDIQGIDHVIHYQVPKKVEIYIHGSGRTARASHRGLSVVLVDPPSRQFYMRLCKGLNRMQDLDIFPIDFEPLMVAIKKRVRLASEIDSLGFRCKKIKMS